MRFEPFWEVLRSYKLKTRFPDKLYHYTSLPGFVSIITSSEIWCSNVRFSNDPAEVIYGHEVIDEIVESELDEYEKPVLKEWLGNVQYFASSFSAAPDSLPQWRAYCANGVGVAAGFDTLKLLYHGRLELYPVEYDRDRQATLVREIVSAYKNVAAGRRGGGEVTFVAELTEALITLAGIFKEAAYEHEQEFRLFTTRYSSHADADFPIKYRATTSLVIPYLAMPLAPDGRLPLLEVVLGPCLDHELTTSSVTAFLKASAYDVGVRASKVKMRGR